MELDTAAKILAKIGNPTRLKIVRLLVRAGDDGLTVGQIQKQLNIPGSTLTHHIAHLKSAGVMRQQRQQNSGDSIPIYSAFLQREIILQPDKMKNTER